MLAQMFTYWSPMAAPSVEKPREWTETELITAAAVVKRLLSQGSEDHAMAYLQGLASERKNILENDARPQVRNAFIKKENAQSVSLLQGLEGRVDGEFLTRAGAFMRVPYVGLGHDHSFAL